MWIVMLIDIAKYLFIQLNQYSLTENASDYLFPYILTHAEYYQSFSRK